MHDSALEVTEGALNQGRASLTFRISDAIESVRIFRREPARYGLLVVTEKVHREVAALFEQVVNGGSAIDADQHERRVEGDG
jgi:hypothetical protein